MAYSTVETIKEHGAFSLATFFDKFISSILNFSIIGKVFTPEYIGTYFKCLGYVTVALLVLGIVAAYKASSQNEYYNKEHGSSDWSEGGEQYRILSRRKGLILAEKNFLPIDKRGNINTLIVGGSGSGKSASYSKPNAYQMLGSYVFTDPKGELYDDTAGYLKAHGYDIKVLTL